MENIEEIENDFINFNQHFQKLLTNYKRKSKRLDKIIKQSDTQQLQVLKLNEELDEYKNQLEKKVEEKTKELQELNANLEKRVQEEVEANQQKDKKIHEQAKFAQLGELISNIAHHWRQPLNAISTSVGSLQVMKEVGLEDPEEEKKTLSNIMETTQMLSSIIDNFRTIAEQKTEKTTFVLQKLLETDVSLFLNSLEQNKIKLKKEFCENDIEMNSVESNISQSVLNILKNAQDALLKIEDRTRYILFKLEDKGETVVITIVDNANGIPKDILPKIFDPYFTTKHQSQGTGLGLYMTRENIEKHLGGKIDVKTNQKGTMFIVTLPKNI